MFKTVTGCGYARGTTVKKGLANFQKSTRHIAHFPCRGRKSSESSTADSMGVSYIRDFSCPHKKKSRHERSGERGGQATGPPHPIHRFGNVIQIVSTSRT
ncbi:hypothetical protein AVEN_18317-1 [Araneus ventricosus]|uniref:Uncharacterized protein n=1 Tax=Araneus ventricosus TaxID=182803 RepID=A0A4Y2ERU0_ARAVE|nr:hypothetical protein AVEN_18317-1 [Araneus ventricosus]